MARKVKEVVMNRLQRLNCWINRNVRSTSIVTAFLVFTVLMFTVGCAGTTSPTEPNPVPTPTPTPTPVMTYTVSLGAGGIPSTLLLQVNKGDTVIVKNDDSVEHGFGGDAPEIFGGPLWPGQSMASKIISSGPRDITVWVDGQVPGEPATIVAHFTIHIR